MFNNNADFYPTPHSLIRKMTSKIDWKMVNSVLEPSGGKGDLLEAIKTQFDYTKNYRRNKNYDIDTIEIDNNLQAILKDKGFRLVHNDFLTYNTYKHYDLIIANFPFSVGDKHLLKAIDMIENQYKSGQIICILNAETIRNPYSNIRKDLTNKLNKYNAEIEFIENAFTDSERKTNVEIALIYIDVQKEANSSVILDELKQKELHNNKVDYENTSLVDSDFIKGIVSQYNHEIKIGLKLIDEYNKLKPFMLRGFDENSSPILKLELERKDDICTLENAYIKQVRSKYWKALFTNEQFIGLFTSNLKQKYLEYVNELQDYDFSLFNIYTLRVQLSKEMIQGVEDTILNLFEEFSYKHYYDEQSKNIHMYNGWKTNKAYKINKKVIIPLNAYNGWFDNAYRPTDYKVLDKLKDIEKVFNYLDDGSTEEIDISDELKLAENYQDSKKIELKYFYLTFYKKGTTHIEFKNGDLLQKFNLFGSQRKGWLPPSYGKTEYKDMTREDREIIDSFEGEESYNKVIKNKTYFIMDTEKVLMLTS